MDTKIVNSALRKLGEERVSNVITDQSERAIIMKEMYGDILKQELTAFPWNFAIKQAAIAKDATAPIWDWDNAYTVPSDFLSILRIQDAPRYAWVNGKIYTDAGSPLRIEYIASVTSGFDPLFKEAFASRLAYEACESLTQSNAKKQIIYEDYRNTISRAYQSDSIQSMPQDLPADEWIEARFQYGAFGEATHG